MRRFFRHGSEIFSTTLQLGAEEPPEQARAGLSRLRRLHKAKSATPTETAP